MFLSSKRFIIAAKKTLPEWFLIRGLAGDPEWADQK